MNRLFHIDTKAQNGVVRFGKVALNGEHEVPAASPTPRTIIEAQAARELYGAGIPMPFITVPVSRGKTILSEMGGVLNPIPQHTLERVVRRPPFVLADPESEALSGPCAARNAFLANKPPTSVMSLLECRLRADRKENILRTDEAWENYGPNWGWSALGKWTREKQRAIKATVYLAPSPIARGNERSVNTALDISLKLADQPHTGFRGTGVHLLLHSDLFRGNNTAGAARTSLIERFREMVDGRLARRRLTVSLKIWDSPDAFNSPGASLMRRNLSDFLFEIKQHIEAMDGLLVMHNPGVWMLGVLTAGVDVASVRCDGKTLSIDKSGFKAPPKAKKRYSNVQRELSVAPWDPHAMCDGDSQRWAKLYSKTGAYPTSDWLKPGDQSTMSYSALQIERTKQIIAGYLDLAKELRDAGREKILLRNAVADRTRRLSAKDATLDLSQVL